MELKNKTNKVVYYLLKDNKVIDHFIDLKYDVNKTKQRDIHSKFLFNWLQEKHQAIPLLFNDKYINFELQEYQEQEQAKELAKTYTITSKYWDKKSNNFVWSTLNINIGLLDCSYWASKDFLNGLRITFLPQGYIDAKQEYKELFKELKQYDALHLGALRN